MYVRLYYVRTVEAGEPAIYLFDCSYKHKEAGARVNESRGTACLVQSGTFSTAAVPLEIAERDWTELMIAEKVDMGQSPLAENFLALSQDPATAMQIVNASVQSVLLEHMQNQLYNPVRVTIGPGGAVILTCRTREPDRLQDLIQLAHQLEAAVGYYRYRSRKQEGAVVLHF